MKRSQGGGGSAPPKRNAEAMALRSFKPKIERNLKKYSRKGRSRW